MTVEHEVRFLLALVLFMLIGIVGFGTWALWTQARWGWWSLTLPILFILAWVLTGGEEVKP
jgi:uncharacterized membrane protein YqjE